MDYLKNWHDNLLHRTSGIWLQTITTKGICHKHTGPRTMFSTVTITFSPEDGLEVSDALDSATLEIAHGRKWHEYIVYGVLDVMLVLPTAPIKNIKIIINQIEFNEIESSQASFRLAARDAAYKALVIHFPNLITIQNKPPS